MMIQVLTLAAFLQTGEGFPLDRGARWIYGSDGREGMTVEVAGTRMIRNAETTILRVRNGSFFWNGHDLFVRSEGAGLALHAGSYEEHVFPNSPALVLLPGSLKAGAAWESRSDREESTFAFRAAVRERGKVTVPAGDFDAWKIEYTLTDHLGTENDFHAWFAPGVGFVKFEFLRQSTRARKTPIDRPWTVELMKFRRKAGAAVAECPKLTDAQRAEVARLLGRLGDESVDAREKAAADLLSLGRGVLPFLDEALRADRSPEVRGRIRDVIGRLPALRVEGVAKKTAIKIGEDLPVEFRLKNLTEKAIHVLPTLDGSDSGWRNPKCGLEIRNDKGELQQLAMKRCGTVNPLRERDFEELGPGDSLSPLHHYLLGWKATRAGTYTVKFTYDTSATDPGAWFGKEESPGDRALQLLESLPRGRFESNTLTITVEP